MTDDMQFGYMSGKGKSDETFIVRQSHEKYRAKHEVCFGFVDVEKAFDTVPREVIHWTMRKLGVGEWLLSAIMTTYLDPETMVRTVYGNSEVFGVLFRVKIKTLCYLQLSWKRFPGSFGFVCLGNCYKWMIWW